MCFPTLGLCVLLLLSAVPVNAGKAEPEETRQFDFWIGDWEVTADGELAGHNRIEPIIGGRALRETWTGSGGFVGTSTNIFDATTGTWKQFWVDNSGLVLLLEGGLVEGSMILSGRRLDPEGRPIVDRITWTPEEDGSVRQLWELSRDDGKSWETVFDGIYRRVQTPSDPGEGSPPADGQAGE